jgi:Ca2+-transporting ATPase
MYRSQHDIHHWVVCTTLFILSMGTKLFHLEDSVHDDMTLRTIVFNVFVFLQIFNQINCRRINGELNVFSGITTNYCKWPLM